MCGGCGSGRSAFRQASGISVRHVALLHRSLAWRLGCPSCLSNPPRVHLACSPKYRLLLDWARVPHPFPRTRRRTRVAARPNGRRSGRLRVQPLLRLLAVLPRHSPSSRVGRRNRLPRPRRQRPGDLGRPLRMAATSTLKGCPLGADPRYLLAASSPIERARGPGKRLRGAVPFAVHPL